jgi:hypothetical protein
MCISFRNPRATEPIGKWIHHAGYQALHTERVSDKSCALISDDDFTIDPFDDDDADDKEDVEQETDQRCVFVSRLPKEMWTPCLTLGLCYKKMASTASKVRDAAAASIASTRRYWLKRRC